MAEVEGATGAAPGAGAREEADLPVVDIQYERPPAPGAGEQTEPEARGTRLGRYENVAVGEIEERRDAPSEAGITFGAHAALRDRAVPGRHPDLRAEARPNHLDLVAG